MARYHGAMPEAWSRAKNLGAPRWSLREDRNIVSYAGRSRENILKHLPGRSWKAVLHRARFLEVNLRQGAWTQKRLCEETGYSWTQILRARQELGLGEAWGRTTKRRAKMHKDGRGGRHFAMTEDEAELLIGHLARPVDLKYITKDGNRSHRWSLYAQRCRICGTDGNRVSERHEGHGICLGCTQKQKRLRPCACCGQKPWTLERLIFTARKTAGKPPHSRKRIKPTA